MKRIINIVCVCALVAGLGLLAYVAYEEAIHKAEKVIAKGEHTPARQSSTITFAG